MSCVLKYKMVDNEAELPYTDLSNQSLLVLIVQIKFIQSNSCSDTAIPDRTRLSLISDTAIFDDN